MRHADQEQIIILKIMFMYPVFAQKKTGSWVAMIEYEQPKTFIYLGLSR